MLLPFYVRGELTRGGKRIVVRLLHPGLHIQDFINQELAYGSDINIGRSGPSLLLDFDDLSAGGSSKVGERDRKLTRVGGRGAVYTYSNRGDSSTRQMGERSNRAGEGAPHHDDSKSRCCSDIDRSKRHFLHWMGSGLLVCLALILEG